jgi:hypothetical protein
MRIQICFPHIAAVVACVVLAACGASPTPQFMVGGAVNGLEGKGLVLGDEKGGSVAIATSGSFVLPDRWAAESTYAVSIKTQPSDPTQVCTVEKGSGTVSGGDVTNVVVACPPTGPTAAFTAPATSVASTAVAFDASASLARDGSSLAFFWEFGDGGRGGGPRIAHVYATSGARSVVLTVTDGAGRSASKTGLVTVSAAPAATASAVVQAGVKTLDGLALGGVAVTVVGGPAAATTDGLGKASLTLDLGVPVVLKFAKSGFADQYLPVRFPSSAGADASLEVVMGPRDAPMTLADAAAGGQLVGRDGASLALPANALVDRAGNPIIGAVQVALTPVDPTQPGGGGFPGSFDGVKTDGASTPLVSFGTVEFALSAGTQALQLAPGKTATISIPIQGAKQLDGSTLTPGAKTPLWSLDEASGVWVQEGEGTVVSAAGSPSGLALQAVVSHLSWWNSDMGFDPYGPDPQCVYDTDMGLIPEAIDQYATITLCNMLAEMDQTVPTAPVRAPGARAAAALSPRIAGYARRMVVPIAGGVTIPVPANLNVALSATALGGTWTGRTVVNGPVGVQAKVLVKMRPIAGTLPGVEQITPPFDATRSLQTGATSTFSFSGAAFEFARVTVSDGTGSSLVGQVRLLQGATPIATASFGPAPAVIAAPVVAGDAYQVVISGFSGTPGAYRVQVELLGGLKTASVQLPFDSSVSVPAFTTYQASLPVAAGQVVLFGYQRTGGNTGNPTMRVRAPDGTTLLTLGAGAATQMATVTLAAAGTYLVELVTDAGEAASYRVTGEQTHWVSVGPPLPTSGGFSLANVVADRNGLPVVGYSNPVVVNSRSTYDELALRRWTGTAWEAIGPNARIDLPCSDSALSLGFAFDTSNAPLIVHAHADSVNSTSYFVAQRLVAGVWQPVGGSAGELPNRSPSASACNGRPAVAFAADGAPLVAYPVGADVVVKRFDGTNWGDVTSAATDRFTQTGGGSLDLGTDANGRPYLVISGRTNGGATTVRRLVSTTPAAWELVGPNGGTLPEIGTQGLSLPKLRFDAGGQPTIAFLARVGSGGITSSGMAVYRFDGAQWSTTGGYQASASSSLNSNGATNAPGFALLGGEAFTGWLNQNNGVSAPLVQKSTATGYVPFGAGYGELQQFYVHGLVDQTGFGPLLVAANGTLYLALVASSSSGTSVPNIYLLKKVD